MWSKMGENQHIVSSDSAVMVDTTTQTPRDDDVTEVNDSKGVDEQQDTTEYTEEQKEDIEGGESTKDSGIHQDEDGYDDSYADEEFEDDEAQDDEDDEEEGIHMKFSTRYIHNCLVASLLTRCSNTVVFIKLLRVSTLMRLR